MQLVREIEEIVVPVANYGDYSSKKDNTLDVERLEMIIIQISIYLFVACQDLNSCFFLLFFCSPSFL